MRASVLTSAAAAAAVLAVVLSGCGSDTDTATSTSSRTTTESSTSEEATETSEPSEPSELPEAPAGANPTIADYVQENGITETPIKMGDPTAPAINLPVPEGWEPLSAEDAPDWAYGVIVYRGPDAGDDPANIAAIVSRLTGNVDPQTIIDLAPGELQNLPGYIAMNEGETSTLGEYPAYLLGGTWVKDGVTRVVAQKTVIIPAADGLYVLQLNVDGLENSIDVLGPATELIDNETTIDP